MSLSPLEQIIQKRASLRHYADRPVSDETLLSLLEAARLAPSAENAQPWRFIAVRDPGAREALARACLTGIFSRTRFAARAPLIVALCAERGTAVEIAKAIKDRAMYQLDCGIAGEHLVLRAAELGLGTCWIGWFDRRAARRPLGVPAHARVVCLIAVGYPAEESAERARPRKRLSDIAWLDSWGRALPGAADQNTPEK
jgi:nitroreductase